MKKYYVNKNSRLVKMKGLPILANVENTAIIGLSSSGVSFWSKIQNEEIVSEKDCLENMELLSSLQELDFISEKEYVTNNKQLNLTSAYLHVSNRCNLNCLGCYSHDDKRNKESDPSLASLKTALKRLHNCSVRSAVISGGEPFLRSDLSKLLYYGKKDLMIEHIAIITNGTVNVDYSKFKDIVDEITVSIDGFSKDVPTFIRNEGIFDAIINTVKLIKKTGINVSILPTLHSKNSSFIHNYKELANELGVELNFSILSVCDTPEFHDFIPSTKNLHELSESLLSLGSSVHDTPIGADLNAGLSCGAANSVISIAADGNIYPCHMLHEKEFTLGNIFTADLTIENINKNVVTYFDNANADTIEDCQDCEYKYFCSSGCRARAYFKYGNISKKDSYCELSKYFYDRLSEQLLENLQNSSEAK